MNREEEAAKVLDCAWRGLDWKTTMNINEAYGLAIKRLREPSGWVRTADRLPTEADAGVDEKILTIYDDGETRVMGTDYWAYVAMVPEMFPYWLPLPKLPEVEE